MYEIAYVWREGYDFVNDHGERVCGSTIKALVLTYSGDTIVRNKVVKVANDYPAPIGIYAQLYFNEYGRLCGGQSA